MSLTRSQRRIWPLESGWEFRRRQELEDWRRVDLPHCPFDVDLDGNEHWQGFCEYRRTIKVGKPYPEHRYALYFGAAMHSAEVSLDGEVVGDHAGGYLPFEIDVTSIVADGTAHDLKIVLDNRDNPDVPPGKPLDELDFCWYGGLYRTVEIREYPPVHISDAIAADEVAGGGVFYRTLSLSADKAVVAARVHVANYSSTDASVHVRIDDETGSYSRRLAISDPVSVAKGGANHFDLQFEIENPVVWSLESPSLVTFRASVCDDRGRLLDSVVERFGLRWIEISRSKGLLLNGKRIRPRGTNRHQDYPRIGYALSDAAQRRDAKKIKESGFDYVRLSHYPQSPAFLSACDELGILVMNCIPGWQFLGGERFREASFRNARELIRRDRNHPSVILWELSLNETEMDLEFMNTLHRIGHEEYPGNQMYTCGWIDHFDVYIRSRQHGRIHSWENGDKALVVAEYGDWEFYALNEGFDQKTGKGLLADWSNSRGFRGHGERKMRQQVRNQELALNDTLRSPAICDGVWSMFDYPRGYNPTRAGCGVMDIFRLPKYSYYFYRSQRDPSERGIGWSGGPMAYIASRWTEGSSLDIQVFTNCESVELFINGKRLASGKPETTATNQALPHPPVVFHLDRFEQGRLEAFGYIGGERVATHRVSTPGVPVAIALEVDDAGIEGSIEKVDTLFAHARFKDTRGQLCQYSNQLVLFKVVGNAEIIGPDRVRSEAGVASVVLKRPIGTGSFKLFAECPGFAVSQTEYIVSADEGSQESAISIA